MAYRAVHVFSRSTNGKAVQQRRSGIALTMSWTRRAGQKRVTLSVSDRHMDPKRCLIKEDSPILNEAHSTRSVLTRRG